jgi:integrase
MSAKNEKLIELIKDKRPNIGASTIKTYTSILANLYKNVFPKDEEMDLKKFEKDKEILEFLKNKPASSRKTTLSALVVITENKAYRSQMMKDIETYNEEIQEQVKTPTQKTNWVDKDEIGEVFKKVKEEAEPLLGKKKADLTAGNFQTIQSYVLLSLLGGIYIAPRRSKDFTDFKVKNINEKVDNYLDGKKLVFNSYKTAKVYKTQEVEIPAELVSILKRWIKVNPTDYLFFDFNYNPLTSVKITQKMNKIFGGKKVSVNILRHSYLTSKFGYTIEQQKEIQKTMSDMGSSSGVLVNYVKK